MHPALWKLIVLHRRATLRRLLRGARTPRGAVFFAIGLLMIALWLVPGVVQALVHGRQDATPILIYLPAALLATCLTQVISSAGERAVAFFPAEVDLLFPAPFTRRQLLAYKLVQSAVGATFVAMLFSLIWLRFSPYWLAAFVGYWLTLIFVQLVSMSMALVGQAIGAVAYSRGRRLMLFVVLALVGLAVGPSIRAGAQHSPREWLELFAASRSGAILLAPFGVFAHLIVAPTLFPDALRYAAIAMALIGALVVVVMWLDVRFEESAAAAGAALYARLQRARRGAALIGPASKTSARWRPPPFPRLGGAGPIARRQLTAALRQSRGIFVLIGLICAGGLIAMFMMEGENDITGLLIAALVWMTLLLTNNLRFDFRGDVDLIDTLKALPVRPAAVAIAQLIVPVLVLFACQVFLLAAAVMLKRVPREVLLIGAAFALPLDAMLMALENLLFLLFPTRMQSTGVGDMQGYGRQIVVMFVKMIVMLIAAGVAAGAGAATYFGGGKSTYAFAITTAFVLSAEVIALIPLLAWAYERFDVSVDTPA